MSTKVRPSEVNKGTQVNEGMQKGPKGKHEGPTHSRETQYEKAAVSKVASNNIDKEPHVRPGEEGMIESINLTNKTRRTRTNDWGTPFLSTAGAMGPLKILDKQKDALVFGTNLVATENLDEGLAKPLQHSVGMDPQPAV